MWRQKVSVYSRKLVCKYNIVLLVSTISFCVLIQGFLVQGCVKSSFSVEKVTF